MLSGGHQALYNSISVVKDELDVYITYRAVDNEEYRIAADNFCKSLPNVKILPLLCSVPPPPSTFHRWKNKIRSLKKLFHRKIVTQIQSYDKQMYWISTISPQESIWLNHIHNICSIYNFDIIQVEMPWMVSLIFTLPKSAIKIFVHHELGFVRRELETENKELDEYTKACKSFVDLNEISQLNLYDAIITLSETDKRKLVDNGVHIPIFPSFAIVNTKAKPIIKTTEEKKVVFIGSDIHPPNFIGINWFLDNCWERLKGIDRNYTIDIIGKWRDEKKEIVLKKHPDVNFLGFVDNLNEALCGSIMIVPITIGSGIRMKILEAMSNGIPFVSTSIGAEGIPVVNGEHCFIADNSEDFVNDIIKLQDSSLQSLFIKNSYKIINDNFSNTALKHNRINIYQTLIDDLKH